MGASGLVAEAAAGASMGPRESRFRVQGEGLGVLVCGTLWHFSCMSRTAAHRRQRDHEQRGTIASLSYSN